MWEILSLVIVLNMDAKVRTCQNAILKRNRYSKLLRHLPSVWSVSIYHRNVCVWHWWIYPDTKCQTNVYEKDVSQRQCRWARIKQFRYLTNFVAPRKKLFSIDVSFFYYFTCCMVGNFYFPGTLQPHGRLLFWLKMFVFSRVIATLTQ